MGQTAYCAVRRLRAKICFGWTLALRSGFAIGSALGLGSGWGTGRRGLRTSSFASGAIKALATYRHRLGLLAALFCLSVVVLFQAR
jgi:hypothetical protein